MNSGKERINLDKLHGELTEAFIEYQYMLDNPMPVPIPSKTEMLAMYQTNAMFNSRVKSLVCGVIFLIEKNLNNRDED